MQERSDKMTSEMKTFKIRMYHSFIYINLLWIVICSIVQIFGHKLKIYIFSEAFVSKPIILSLIHWDVQINSIYPEDVENEWHQQCRSNMLAGFPPFEFFFLFFYILLITIQVKFLYKNNIIKSEPYGMGHYIQCGYGPYRMVNL